MREIPSLLAGSIGAIGGVALMIQGGLEGKTGRTVGGFLCFIVSLVTLAAWFSS